MPISAGVPIPREWKVCPFEAFSSRDVEGMIALASPETTLRPFLTSQLTGRTGPYVGPAGLREFIQDVATVWDQFKITPLAFRQTQSCVIMFGTAEARRGSQRLKANGVWVVRLEGDKLASLDVFPDHGNHSQLDASQLTQVTGGRHVTAQLGKSSGPERFLRWERAGSLTGAACIARSLTSRQDMPSLTRAGPPMRIAVLTSTAWRITP
jgi:ketosteroid isomerase-like protein